MERYLCFPTHLSGTAGCYLLCIIQCCTGNIYNFRLLCLGYMFGFGNDFHIRLLNLACHVNPYLHFSWPFLTIFHMQGPKVRYSRIQ